ncbi:MAG: hypothetical protein HIU89_16835 [Proteobacteria bacterium]|nr:hypothetical protein [Pseudomonadota bacterium]
MPNISHKTLVIAIQTVASEMRHLRATFVAGDAEPEEYQYLEDVEQAAEDLERAYDEASRTVINLPPYDELVGRES